jgi:NAD dependent epimerase/dehydratase family enzyme
MYSYIVLFTATAATGAVCTQEFDESGSKGGGFLADVVEAWEAEALKAQVLHNILQSIHY